MGSNRPQGQLNLLHENYPTKSYGSRMYFFILMSMVIYYIVFMIPIFIIVFFEHGVLNLNKSHGTC